MYETVCARELRNKALLPAQKTRKIYTSLFTTAASLLSLSLSLAFCITYTAMTRTSEVVRERQGKKPQRREENKMSSPVSYALCVRRVSQSWVAKQ